MTVMDLDDILTGAKRMATSRATGYDAMNLWEFLQSVVDVHHTCYICHQTPTFKAGRHVFCKDHPQFLKVKHKI